MPEDFGGRKRMARLEGAACRSRGPARRPSRDFCPVLLGFGEPWLPPPPLPPPPVPLPVPVSVPVPVPVPVPESGVGSATGAGPSLASLPLLPRDTACLVGVAVWIWLKHDVGRLVLGYALAINFAYLAVKLSCALAGCCHAEIAFAGRRLGLRPVEIATTVLIIVAASALALVSLWLGALMGFAGHCLLRLFSRAKRGRWSSGWPPLRQPGAELAPLQMLSLIAVLGLAWTA